MADEDEQKRQSPTELILQAREVFAEVAGRPPESVSGFSRREDGWRMNLEVVEMARIPPTTDVLATYEVDLTEDGDLAGYRRVRRYYRNQAEGDEE